MTLNFVIPEMNIGGTGTPPLQFFRRGFNLNGSSGGGGWTDIILHGNTALTLVNAKANGLNYLKLFGGTEQSGTPTPTVPVDIVCNNGAIKYSLNIANVNEQTALVGYYISSTGVVTADVANWIYQDYIPVEPSTTYTLTISIPVYYVTISEYSTADDGGFIRRNAGSTGGNTTLTITTRSNTKYIRFGTNIRQQEITLQDVLAINWMLNIGNTMAYHPYGEIYTDGTVETVEITGNNIFNKNDTANIGNWYAGPSNTILSANANETLVMRAKPSTTYYFKHCSVKGGCRAFYTEVEDWEIGSACSNARGNAVVNANVVYSITTSANAKWIFFNYGRNNVEASFDDQRNDFMVSTSELTSDTTYESYYYGGSATAKMLLKVGDYQDVQSVLDGNVTRNVGIKVLDGTEAWVRSDQSGFMYVDNLIQFSINAPLCSHYLGTTSASASGSNKIRLAMSGSNYRTIIYASLSDYQTAESFKQFLADQYANGTPVIVVYPLAEPTTETVTDQTLNIQAGTNTVEITQASMDNLGLEVSYKGKEGE